MANLSARVKALEREARAQSVTAALERLPERLRVLVPARYAGIVAHPLADGGQWYAWPAGPFNHEQMRYTQPETVPPGAAALSRADIDTLTAAGVTVLRIQYIDLAANDY